MNLVPLESPLIATKVAFTDSFMPLRVTVAADAVMPLTDTLELFGVFDLVISVTLNGHR